MHELCSAPFVFMRCSPSRYRVCHLFISERPISCARELLHRSFGLRCHCHRQSTLTSCVRPLPSVLKILFTNRQHRREHGPPRQSRILNLSCFCATREPRLFISLQCWDCIASAKTRRVRCVFHRHTGKLADADSETTAHKPDYRWNGAVEPCSELLLFVTTTVESIRIAERERGASWFFFFLT